MNPVCDELDKIMEEELNYVAVTFQTNDISTYEQPNNMEIVYDEVKAWEINPAIPENGKKAHRCTLLHLVAAGLGIICAILVSVIITFIVHFYTIMSAQHREYMNLTTQNLQLRTEKTDLERQTEELTRQRDGLNWTVGVILEYDNFPVNTHCPQKVCKPCLDEWVLFQSNCYLFSTSSYSYYWRTWQGSREQCRNVKADLVVIESQEEQEFINNHMKAYDDDKHGYWIGLNKMDTWMWVDGSNFSVTYWKAQNPGYRVSCALSQPQADPLANWQKTSCDMKNRWICETRALIKSD